MAALVLCLAGTAQLVNADSDAAAVAAKNFLEHQTRTLDGDVDVELYRATASMPPCVTPRPFWPGRGRTGRAGLTDLSRGGKVTVAVSCGENDTRVRYLQARVTVTGQYLVAARDIGAGEVLKPGMVHQRTGKLSDVPDRALQDMGRITGFVTTRPLASGTVLQEYHLRALPLVERRQPVTLEMRGRGFRVSRRVLALDSGGLREQVRVKLSNRKVLTGTVSGRGTVTVEF